MKLFLICTSLFLVSAYPSYGQKQTTPEEIVLKFFTIYKTDSISNAITYLFTTNKYAADVQPDITNLKDKLYSTHLAMGRYTGYSLLSTKNIGNDIILMTYIVKYQKLPLFFKFLFYRPEGSWQIQDLGFDNKIDAELK